MELSCGHRVCLTLVLLGLLLQAAMFCAPYWFRIDVLGNVYTATLGPLIACSPQNVFGAVECNLLNFDRNFSWFEISRWVSGSGAALGLILAFALCCTLCCNSDTTVVCQGVAVFISAGLCVAGAGLFAARYKELGLGGLIVGQRTLDWAFYTFIVDSSLLVLISIIVCCLPRVARLDVHPV